MVCRQESPQELYARILSADPVPIKAGEYQGDIATEYAATCLRAAKEYSTEPSECTASDSSSSSSSSSIQQGFKQPLDNTGYKADPRPVSEQRSE